MFPLSVDWYSIYNPPALQDNFVAACSNYPHATSRMPVDAIVASKVNKTFLYFNLTGAFHNFLDNF